GPGRDRHRRARIGAGRHARRPGHRPGPVAGGGGAAPAGAVPALRGHGAGADRAAGRAARRSDGGARMTARVPVPGGPAAPPVQLIIAAAVGGLAAAVTGLVTVRSRGVYFLMLTLAIGELARQLTESWVSVTGGTNGLAGVPALRVVPGGGAVLVPGHVYWYV